MLGFDMGFKKEDIKYVLRKTKHIINTKGFSGTKTAEGIYSVMEYIITKTNIKKPRIVIQGYGDVGRPLAILLSKKYGKNSLRITCASKKTYKLIKDEGYGLPTTNKYIFTQKYDIFSPCAIPYVINPNNASKIKCKYIIGSANNPLLNEIETIKILLSRGIAYIPDFIVNSGGVCYLIERFIKKRINFQKIVLSNVSKYLDLYNKNYDVIKKFFDLKPKTEIEVMKK